MSTQKVIKLESDEIQTLRVFQQTWMELTKRLGEIHYEKRILESEINDIGLDFDELDQKRLEYINRLQEKYGSGQVNLQTEEFIPDPHES